MSSEIGECRACPSCGDRAQPEQDGDLVYWACGCGHEFGYYRVAQQEEGCQLGIPEGVRLAAGGIDLSQLAVLGGVAPGERAAVFLGHIRMGPPESGVFDGELY